MVRECISPPRPDESLAPAQAGQRHKILLLAVMGALAAHLLCLLLLRQHPSPLSPPGQNAMQVIFTSPPALRQMAPIPPLDPPRDSPSAPAPETAEQPLPSILPLIHLPTTPRASGRQRAATPSTVSRTGAAAPPSPASAAPSAAPTGHVAPARVAAPSCGVATPPYPPAARLMHESGTAIIVLTVAPGGRINNVTLGSSSSSDALDNAALEAGREGRCTNDTPEPATLRLPVRFHLDEED